MDRIADGYLAAPGKIEPKFKVYSRFAANVYQRSLPGYVCLGTPFRDHLIRRSDGPAERFRRDSITARSGSWLFAFSNRTRPTSSRSQARDWCLCRLWGTSDCDLAVRYR